MLVPDTPPAVAHVTDDTVPPGALDGIFDLLIFDSLIFDTGRGSFVPDSSPTVATVTPDATPALA